MTKRRWLNTAITEAAKRDAPAAFSRQGRAVRAAAPAQDKPIRAA